jgi:hypothetical protein
MANKQEKVMKIEVDPKERESILTQLFEGNEAKKDIEVLPGKIKATIANLNARDQLDIEAEMSATDGSNAYILHLYSLKLLSKTVREYNGQTFENAKACERFLEKLPSMVLDKMVKEQNVFERTIRDVLKLETIDEHFFDQEAATEESKQPLEGSTSEKKGV